MRRLHSMLVVIVLLIAAFVAGARAATRTYQFTGIVKAVAGDALTVEKSAKETWQFEIAMDTKGATPKVGDRVTVNYKMVTTNIEANPGSSTATKKK
jgi:archaellum component FlaG (FlaF/FlaG flagellin family)